MDKQNNGGPAFPVTEQHGSNYGECGMSLRDYFAGQALPSCIGHSPTVDAARAYEYADAMLAARG